jgi:hypothetical protein
MKKNEINAYNTFKDFVKACKSKKAVIHIERQAEKDARKYFKLKSKQHIREFIGNGGIQNPRFINKKIWETRLKVLNIEIWLFAYEFNSLGTLGYIAIAIHPKSNEWILKSFHPSSNSNDMMKLAFEEAVKKISGD